MKIHLPPQKRKAVRFILRYKAEHADGPTMKMVAKELGVSVGTAQEYLNELQRKEAIRWSSGNFRSVEVLVDPDTEELADPALERDKFKRQIKNLQDRLRRIERVLTQKGIIDEKGKGALRRKTKP